MILGLRRTRRESPASRSRGNRPLAETDAHRLAAAPLLQKAGQIADQFSVVAVVQEPQQPQRGFALALAAEFLGHVAEEAMQHLPPAEFDRTGLDFDLPERCPTW